MDPLLILALLVVTVDDLISSTTSATICSVAHSFLNALIREKDQNNAYTLTLYALVY